MNESDGAHAVGKYAKADHELKNPRYAPREMWNNHKEILRLLSLGLQPSDVARQLGVTPQVVSYTKCSPLGKQKLAELDAEADGVTVDIKKRIKELAPMALDTLAEVMTDSGNKASDRVRAAIDLLDRAGHAAPTVVKGEMLHGHFTASDIEALKARARSAGAIIGSKEVMEVTAEPAAGERSEASLCSERVGEIVRQLVDGAEAAADPEAAQTPPAVTALARSELQAASRLAAELAGARSSGPLVLRADAAQ